MPVQNATPGSTTDAVVVSPTAMIDAKVLWEASHAPASVYGPLPDVIERSPTRALARTLATLLYPLVDAELLAEDVEHRPEGDCCLIRHEAVDRVSWKIVAVRIGDQQHVSLAALDAIEALDHAAPLSGAHPIERQ